MNKQDLIELIYRKRSFLCVGLDTDINKIPKHLLDSDDPIFEFNRQIIDATIDFTIAYKPNIAFYECMGINGFLSLERTINYLESRRNEVFLIADAKRGDIGNTSEQYAKAFLTQDGFNFDAITVSPYMGEDSISPFLNFLGKWVIILALTSNAGSNDFQLLETKNGYKIFEEVILKSKSWGSDENIMFVVGATKASMLFEIRKIVPEHFLLIPGVGAQGGSLDEIVKYGFNKNIGLIVNASRSILYASSGKDFAQKARFEASILQKEMQNFLQ